MKQLPGSTRTRFYGLIEWVCEHDQGHSIGHRSLTMKGDDYLHCCDGCCTKLSRWDKLRLIRRELDK